MATSFSRYLFFTSHISLSFSKCEISFFKLFSIWRIYSSKLTSFCMSMLTPRASFLYVFPSQLSRQLLAQVMTCSGNPTILAIQIPQLSSIPPSLTLYSRCSRFPSNLQSVNWFLTPGTESLSPIISWKWVANKQQALSFSVMNWQTAHAIPKPSEVLVPRPSQSMSTSEWLLAVSSMHLVSIISLMKVEIPLICRSDAPTLVMMESMMGVSKMSPGTQHPMCVRQQAIPIVLIYVDLPPILGPVSTMVLASSSSLHPFPMQFLMQGCLKLVPEILPPIRGLHHPLALTLTTEAQVVSTSSSERIRDSFSMIVQQPATTSNIFFSTSCCWLSQLSSKAFSLSFKSTSFSVVNVILVCLVVKNLYLCLPRTFQAANFLDASKIYLQL